MMSGPSAATQNNLGQTTEVTAPSNAHFNPIAFFNAVSCTSAGNCVGVGRYTDSSDQGQAMAATETDGTFGQATEVSAPANTEPELFGVSCTSAGNCVSVGTYGGLAMEVTETGGAFGQATEVSAPSNAFSDSMAVLNGVSCPSAGNCVAVGSYLDSSGLTQAMEATETGGTFAQATEVTAPSNVGSDPGAQLFGVSCTSPGNCVGVGRYLDSSGDLQAVEATETGGTFEQATEVTAPSDAASDPEAQLFGVSCTSAGNCVGVGNYRDSSLDFQAMEVTETGGTFGQATEVTAPSNAASNTVDVLHELDGVSCTSPGNCVGVGSYLDSSGLTQAMEATETGGTFGQATEVTAPSNAASDPEAGLDGVSCPATGSCVGVGGYTDSSGDVQAMATTPTAHPTTTALASSPDPAKVGQKVSYTASVGVVPPGMGLPTGTVSFSDNGTPITGCDAVTLAGGQASCTVTYSATGSHIIVATYSGDANFMASTSPELGEAVVHCLFGTFGCDLFGANLVDADLAGQSYAWTNLAQGDLAGADLTDTTFVVTTMAGTDLIGADLSEAKLVFVDLSHVNLTNANLKGATLFFVNVSGATWSNTTCPDGTNSNADGGTCAGHL